MYVRIPPSLFIDLCYGSFLVLDLFGALTVYAIFLLVHPQNIYTLKSQFNLFLSGLALCIFRINVLKRH